LISTGRNQSPAELPGTEILSATLSLRLESSRTIK
jgi:hypothetical protein